MTFNRLEQAVPSKHNDLEDHIEELRELDKLRIRSANLRDRGISALEKWIMNPLETRGSSVSDDKQLKLIRARVAATLYHHSKKSDLTSLKKFKEITDKLMPLCKDLNNIGGNGLPVLDAAHILDMLISAPNSAFSKAALLCFYRILREMYAANAPNWVIGGLRATDGGPVSACMTSLCIHSLLNFAEAQDNTAQFLKEIQNFLKQLGIIINMPEQEKWKQIEIERLRDSYYLTLESLAKPLVLHLENLNLEVDPEHSVFDQVLAGLVPAIKEVQNSFESAIKELEGFRKREQKDISLSEDSRKKFERSELGHIIGLAALENGKKIAERTLDELHEHLEQAKKYCGINILLILNDLERDGAITQEIAIDDISGYLAENIKILQIVEKAFYATASDTLKSRYPAENYLKGVLEHQLAAAESGNNSTWEPYELAFSAECLSAMDRQRWSMDKRLIRAAQVLSHTVSDRGLFPLSQPFHYSNSSGGQFVSQINIIYSISELIRSLPKVGIGEIKIDFIKSLLHFFEDNFIDSKPDFLKDSQRKNKLMEGWCNEHASHPRTPDPYYTAKAVRTLASLNNLLDERINSIVLGYFKVLWPKDVKLNLDDLFYPDYGLAHMKGFPNDEQKKTLKSELKNKKLRNEPFNKDQSAQGDNDNSQIKILEAVGGEFPNCERPESVAIILQRIRSHILKIRPRKNSKNSVHSLVLHGPAGTGKTTLVEALAKSCKVPLVEVTPSDIVIGGMEAVERRARAVFEALALLTRAVILFDEFDPVLWRRDPTARTPANVFNFLTPGMLPKLKNLHDQTERRSVAYILSTNLIGSLDNAAVRNGRFDEKIGIFPPDCISRTGRLYHQYYGIFKQNAENQATLHSDEVLKDRIDYIVEETKGGPMETLGRPGWFTAPKLDNYMDNNTLMEKVSHENETPFAYLYYGNTKLVLEREAKLHGIVGEGETAIKEWMQWYWVEQQSEQIK